MTKISIPQHEESFYPHEREILRCDANFIVVCAHRRARKTTTILNKALIEALRKDRRPGVVFIVFPTTVTARDIVWRDPMQLWRVFPQEVVAKVQEQEMNIYLKNRSVISVRGSDDINRLVGTGGKAYFLDEYSIMKKEVWQQAVYPIIRENNGIAYISGTPRGKNHFYELWLRGQDPSYPDWKSFYYPADETNVFSKEELVQMEKEMSSRLFNQEIMCKWLESEGVVFRGIREVATLEQKRPHPSNTYVIGIDLARLQDFTAISVFNIDTNEMVYVDRWNQIDWQFQASRIASIAQRYNNALCVVEANNIGDAVIDMLLRDGVGVQPFKTTSISKKELIEKLSIYIEAKKIKLLNDEALIGELENYGYSLTTHGNVTYGAMAGHDDMVMSTALAVTYLYPTQRKRPSAPKGRLSQFYQKLKYKAENPDWNNNIIWNEWGDPNAYYD